MKIAIPFYILFALGASLAPKYAAATPMPESSIPHSVDWFAHLDFDQLRSSRVGAALFEEIRSIDPLKNNENIPINPVLVIDGLKGLTSFGTMPDLQNPGGEVDLVVMLNGTPDLMQVFRGLLAGFQLEQPEAIESIAVGDQTILSMKQAGVSGIFLGEDSVALSKSLDSLKTFLSVRTGETDHLDVSSKFMLPTHDEAMGLYLGVFVDGIGSFEELPVQARILQLTEAVAVQLGESGDNLHLLTSMVADNPNTAQQVQEVLKGIIAMMILTQNNPDLAHLVESARVNRAGNAVSLKLDYPAASAEKWVGVFAQMIAAQLAAQPESAEEADGTDDPDNVAEKNGEPDQEEPDDSTPAA